MAKRLLARCDSALKQRSRRNVTDLLRQQAARIHRSRSVCVLCAQGVLKQRSNLIKQRLGGKVFLQIAEHYAAVMPPVCPTTRTHFGANGRRGSAVGLRAPRWSLCVRPRPLASTGLAGRTPAAFPSLDTRADSGSLLQRCHEGTQFSIFGNQRYLVSSTRHSGRSVQLLRGEV